MHLYRIQNEGILFINDVVLLDSDEVRLHEEMLISPFEKDFSPERVLSIQFRICIIWPLWILFSEQRLGEVSWSVLEQQGTILGGVLARAEGTAPASTSSIFFQPIHFSE